MFSGIGAGFSAAANGIKSIISAFAASAGIWTAIIAGTYLAVKAIKAMEQSWNELNAAMGESRLDATMTEYDAFNDKIAENNKLLEDAKNAEARAYEDANNLLDKKIGMMEEQAALLQKLKGLREDEAKKAQDAQDAIAKGKEKEADLVAQLADDKKAEAKASLDKEIELQKAKVDKYKAEFDGLEKVSNAALRAAAKGQGVGGNQADFMQKARLAVAAQNLSIGVNDPSLGRETKYLANRELTRRAEQAKLDKMEEQKKSFEKDPTKEAQERTAKTQRAIEANKKEMEKHQGEKDAATKKGSEYDQQIGTLEQQFKAAGNMLWEFAKVVGNEDAMVRLRKVSISMKDENVKITQETEIFAEQIGGIASAISHAQFRLEEAQIYSGYQEGETKTGNAKIEKKKAGTLRASADRAIADWQRVSGDQFGYGMDEKVREEIRTNPEAYKKFEGHVAEMKRKHKMDTNGEIVDIYTDEFKQENRNFNNEIKKNIKPINAPKQATTVVAGINTTNTLLGDISKKLDNATIVRTDQGRT